MTSGPPDLAAARRVDVALTACGVVSAFGRGAEALWQGLLSGRSRVAVCPELGTATDGAPLLAARVPDDALGHPATEARTDALIAAAAQELTESPAWRTVNPARLGVCLGTTQGPIGRWTRDQQALAGAEVDGAAAPQPPSLAAPTFNLARALGARGAGGLPLHGLRLGHRGPGPGAGLDSAPAPATRWWPAGPTPSCPSSTPGFTSLSALDPALPRPFDRHRAGLGLGEGAAPGPAAVRGRRQGSRGSGPGHRAPTPTTSPARIPRVRGWPGPSDAPWPTPACCPRRWTSSAPTARPRCSTI